MSDLNFASSQSLVPPFSAPAPAEEAASEASLDLWMSPYCVCKAKTVVRDIYAFAHTG